MSDTPIWYVFLRSDGTYQGSGTPHFDDDTYGSTLVPVPDHGDGEQAVWDGDAWHVVQDYSSSEEDRP